MFNYRRDIPDAALTPENQGYHSNCNAENCAQLGLRLGWAMAE